MYDDVGSAADDAALVISELVSNCVRADAHTLHVALEGHHDRLRIESTDDAPGLPTPRHAEPTVPNGRGLLIVEKLTREWGVRDEPPEKTVWAELEIPPGARASFECRHSAG